MKIAYISAIAASIFLIGCAPNRFPVPAVDIPERYIYVTKSIDSLSEAIDIYWWHCFNDPILNELIITALNNNRNLLTAYHNLEQAKLNISLTRSMFLPSSSIDISGGGKYSTPTKIVQTYGVGPAVAWELSLFGKMRNSTRAAQAQFLSSQQAMRGVMLSLTAEVATTYFTLLRYYSSLDIATRSYQLRKESTDLVDSLVRYGMTTDVNLERALSLTATAAADIPLYRRAIIQTSLSLNTLLGESPTTPYIPTFNPFDSILDTTYFSPIIPIGLPSTLLERRPDVMEAYYNMVAAWAEVGVAQAARFPSIAITSEGGVGSASLKSLFNGKPFVWSASVALTQPIFAFGANKRNEQIARQQLYTATSTYEQAILTALSEVESALVAVSSYREQLSEYRKLLDANLKTQQMTTSLYDNGLSAYLDVIDAERELYASQLQYITILSEQYINYVSLYKSLGGGW